MATGVARHGGCEWRIGLRLADLERLAVRWPSPPLWFEAVRVMDPIFLAAIAGLALREGTAEEVYEDHGLPGLAAVAVATLEMLWPAEDGAEDGAGGGPEGGPGAEAAA